MGKKYASKELGEQTLTIYQTHIKNHILPTFSHKRLDQIKPIHIVNWLDDLKRTDKTENQLSSSTKKYVYRVMRNIMERATEWQLISSNSLVNVKKPKEDKREVNVYTNKEIEELFEHAQNQPLYWRVFTSLALAAGLRRGELLGLEWKHIDFENNKVHVRQSIGRGKDNKPIIKSTKSGKARTVSLPASVMIELVQYKSHWETERDDAGDSWIENEHEFVFCNIDGKHFYPTTPTTWWRRFTTKAKVRYIRLHDLRHTSATLLINQGVHAKIISERLGHADIRITMDTYGHALEIADQEAANKLDSIFDRIQTKSTSY
ncbi:site-specific integrase [Aquibacillus koreensis]|uniref:Site-specific integrase n=1 Tax=Aquibacillus koreensis TaxID=279446 RepID=A0A9X4AHE0_9BACI|nr:site-specific integrase [Aquibacillus koreensis]MCT2535693.1 site-specific integrase [Aquibacillus koreensis]MDC3420022.1 site-specific integrase [Aquibacillus koreensis]